MNLYLQDLEKAAAHAAMPQTGNVLVAGATGLIGSCLTDLLMNYSCCHVYALGRNRLRAQQRFTNYWDNPRFHFVEHDICQPLVLDIEMPYIIHAASSASPQAFLQIPVEVMKSNLQGLSLLVEYGLTHGMQRMVYVSSGEVYGEGNGSLFTEQSSGYIDILSPRACYPSSKRAAETLCAAYCQEYGAQIVIARPCHTYGPGFTDSDNRAYAQFIRSALRGEDIVMKSTGCQLRSWIYVVDCASAILMLLTKGCSGEAYNIANSSSNISIRQLAEKIAAIAGCRVVMDVADDGNTTPITKAIFSTEKIEKLGWCPLFSIDDGLRHTIQILRN